MLTVADMGGGGVKIGQKSADVLYGRPLRLICKDSMTYIFKVHKEGIRLANLDSTRF